MHDLQSKETFMDNLQVGWHSQTTVHEYSTVMSIAKSKTTSQMHSWHFLQLLQHLSGVTRLLATIQQ